MSKNEAEVAKVEVVSVMSEVQKDIKSRIVELNSTVRDSYVNAEVQAKLASRVELVKKAIVEVATLQKEIVKIKPDQVLYDCDGKVAQSLYSKELVEKRGKAYEKAEKIEKALSKAFDTADYTDLENLVK
jgi:hypothetical protein